MPTGPFPGTRAQLATLTYEQLDALSAIYNVRFTGVHLEPMTVLSRPKAFAYFIGAPHARLLTPPA